MLFEASKGVICDSPQADGNTDDKATAQVEVL